MSDDLDDSENVLWNTSRYQKGSGADRQTAKARPEHWPRYQSGPASFMRLQQAYTAPAEQVLAQYRAAYPHMQALDKRLREEGFVSDGMDGWRKTDTE